MPMPDSTLYTRHRKRKLSSGGARLSRSFFMDTPSAWSSGMELFPVEETWDRNNLWYKREQYIKSQKDKSYRKDLRKSDWGGPFSLVKESVDMGIDRIYNLAHSSGSYSRYYGYEGPLVAQITTDTAMRAGPFANPWESSSEDSLDEYGTTAIARCAPASPHSSVYTAVGELYREGLPSIPGLTSLQHSDVGGEYLNFQFGILPILADIRNLHGALSKSERILKQYYRDSGRLVRRGYRFPTEETLVSRTVTSNHLPKGGNGASNAYLWLNTGTLETTITEKVDRWFSGAFTYHAVEPNGLLGKLASQIQGYNHLLGVLPTSDALWNLAPWSWAADWVTNMGDAATNLSMFQSDGLVMWYGYIMEHKIREITYHHSGSRAKLYGGGSTLVTTTQRFTQETKRRRPATPFGFGLTPTDLTSRQMAIIAALGLTWGSAPYR